MDAPDLRVIHKAKKVIVWSLFLGPPPPPRGGQDPPRAEESWVKSKKGSSTRRGPEAEQSPVQPHGKASPDVKP